ncbi:hypothetical protein SSX86_009635 [Deinandra increscens subsp. villosa]|uniref:ABC transporter domain-containing protein n=1 Tax=Deinandra increscens subsp. villosa TaxID=3103831 RepID=A0AAP0H476_9ASTR
MGSIRKINGICPEPAQEQQRGCCIEIVEPDQTRVTEKIGRGACLTWEKLGVAVSSSNGKNGYKSILSDASGYAKPGEIVAIMGPSGCGKSTLLDSLAGRLASNTRRTGRILVNGRKSRLAFGTMAYMTQEQVLTWTLTVKETVYYSAELQLPKSMPKSMKMERADTTIREMGLQDSINTRIGGWGIKGLSGGQKRRLTICLELLTHPKFLLLDEPVSGLDSASSYYVMSRIVKLTREYRMTVVAAIHQPSSQVFGLFNSLCLLSLGKTLYFGPTFAANQFFAENGFPCPDLQCPADHYLMTINTDFDEETKNRNVPDEVIDVLAKAYKSSEAYMDTQREITTLCAQARISMILFVSSFLTILAIGGFPSFVEETKVFQCERLNGHYGVGSYVISHAVSSTPYLLLISLIPGAIAYSFIGLQRQPTQFIYFELVVLMAMLLVECQMMIVAAIVPNLLMGIICSAGVQGLMILGAGFFRLPNHLPLVFWKYPMYYVSFHRYALEGLYKNEFDGLRFPAYAGGPPVVDGKMLLTGELHVEMGYSKWVDLGILFGMVVAYRIMFFGIVKMTEKVRPIVRDFMSSYTFRN